MSLDFEGKTYEATYSVTSGVVTVQSVHGSSSTQIGGSRAEIVARQLLREILEGAKSRGELSS